MSRAIASEATRIYSRIKKCLGARRSASWSRLWSWLAELESRSVADFNASKAFPNHALTVQNRFADATRWHQTGCKSLFQAINYRANDPAISWTLRIIELDNN